MFFLWSFTSDFFIVPGLMNATMKTTYKTNHHRQYIRSHRATGQPGYRAGMPDHRATWLPGYRTATWLHVHRAAGQLPSYWPATGLGHRTTWLPGCMITGQLPGNYQAPGQPHYRATELPGCLATGLPGCLGIGLSGYRAVWQPVSRATWQLPGHRATVLLGYRNAGPPGYRTATGLLGYRAIGQLPDYRGTWPPAGLRCSYQATG